MTHGALCFFLARILFFYGPDLYNSGIRGENSNGDPTYLPRGARKGAPVILIAGDPRLLSPFSLLFCSEGSFRHKEACASS